MEFNYTKNDLEINTLLYNNKVSVNIEFKNENFTLSENSNCNKDASVLEFIIKNFYNILISNKDHKFKDTFGGNIELIDTNDDKPKRVTFLYKKRLYCFTIKIKPNGKFELFINHGESVITDIINLIQKFRDNFSDEDYITEIKNML